ncbi:MAG TPA: tRNA lysidine(34) synthetase TilS [Bacteroidales bacterium]|nr:tRNA lysidine(34) synthetase TilS [Bacteroidales bacterium]
MEPVDLIRFISKNNLFDPGKPVLLAVSGGMDSMVMAHLVSQTGYHFGIAHCNFCLRGTESDDDEKFVKEVASRMNVPFYSTRFSTLEVAELKGVSIQMAARELRYDWFEKIRAEHGYKVVATAHHLRDQAETFLINLVRGTGIAGLHGIPIRSGNVVRPLMFAMRNEIEEYARHHHVDFRHDRSNDEIKYTRNRIRHQVIPVLEEINPDFIRGLMETIRRISEFEMTGLKTLDDWSLRVLRYEGEERVFDIDSLPSGVPQGPYLWKILSPFGFNETQMENLQGALPGEGRKSFLSPTHLLVKERGSIRIRPRGSRSVDSVFRIDGFKRTKKLVQPLPLAFRRITRVENYEIPVSPAIASLDFDKLEFPLTLRQWKIGDFFYPLGLKKRKKLSDFFMDRKLSQKTRENTWLLCSAGRIVWIVGQRIDHRFRVTAATREILRIEA